MTETGRFVDELVSDDVKTVAPVEVERAVTSACPHETSPTLTSAIDPCTQQLSADALPLEMLGDSHAAELHGEGRVVVRPWTVEPG